MPSATPRPAPRVPTSFADRVQGLFGPFDRPDSPGVVLLVQKDGQDVFAGAWGQASINMGVPLTRRSRLRTGSQSKQFTVLLALLLEAEGKLSMDDAVHDHLPWLPDLGHRVTLAHLATNTSGWRDHFQTLVLSGLSLLATSDRQTTLDAIARQEALNFAPGSAVSYSNSGFILLGEIVRQIEGRPLAEVLRTRITDPLGMTDTVHVERDGLAMPRVATHYTRGPEGWYAPVWGLPIGGEGGMISTVDDMAVWLANFTAARVGTPEILARMQTPPRIPTGTASGYGMGLLCQTYRGRRFVGHGGWVSGGRSEGGRFPDDGLSIVLLANCDTIAPLSLTRRVADAWFGDAMPPPLAFASGRYRKVGGREVIEVRHHQDQPQIMSAGGGFDALDCDTPLGAAREGGIIATHYRPETDGTIATDTGGTAGRMVPLPDVARAAAELTGTYRLAAQGMVADLATDLHRGTIVLRSDIGVLRGTVEAVDADLWLMRLAGAPTGPGAPWTAILAVTDAGFVLETARNKGLHFEKQL